MIWCSDINPTTEATMQRLAQPSLAKIAARYPIGTPVRYYSIAGGRTHVVSVIRSEPWALGHGAVVIKIKGVSGGVSTATEHLQLID